MTGIKTAYRLEIEGLPVEAVTDPAMERTLADGRQRVVGLSREGLQIEEQVDIARAEIESSGMQVSIVDRQSDAIWTDTFTRRAGVRTYLTASVQSANSAASFYVDSTTGWSAGDIAQIGTEALLVDATGSDGTGPFLSVLAGGRGYWGTTGQYHFTADGADLVRPVITKTYPTTIEGRRAKLYRYVVGEDALDGNGTQVWLGLCTTDAKLTGGTTWSLQVDPITSLFGEDLGSDLEQPFLPRGIHYPEDAPLDLIFGPAATSEAPEEGRAVTSSINPLKTCKLRVVGFWETNADFVEWLQPRLEEATLTSPTDYIESNPDTSTQGKAQILASPLSVDVAYTSLSCDTFGTGWAITLVAGADGGLAFDRTSTGAEGDIRIAYYSGSGSVTSGDVVRYSFGEAQVPRGVYGRNTSLTGEVDLGTDFAGTDFYLDNPVAADADDELQIDFGPRHDEPVYNTIAAVNSTTNRVRLDSMPRAIYYSPAIGIPRLRVRRLYTAGTFYQFLAQLGASSPANANKGAQPFLVASDMDLDPDVFTEAERGLPLLSLRRYLAAQEIELGELISHECRLLGMFPHLSATGKLTFSLLTLPTASTPADFEITDANRIVDSEWPAWERNAWGSFNTVTILTNYDPNEEEHRGPPFQVRDLTALASRKNTRELEIAPLSMDTSAGGAGAGFDWTYDDAVVVSQKVLGIFGRPYVKIVFEVPYTLATTALVGSVGRVAFPRLPDTTTGDRGLTEAVGLVTGRMWALDMEERVQISMIVTDEPIAGYAPSATLSNGVDGGGNKWAFDLTLTDPEGVESTAPDGVDAADLFDAGDEVEVVEWNSATQAVQTGSIVSVSASSVEILFDSTFTEPATYYMRFAAAGSVVSSQEEFAFYAADDAEIDFASGADPADVWAA
jgi:hypothetical protein